MPVWPVIWMERVPLKREIVDGPEVNFGFKSVSSGTIVPEEDLTKMNFI